MPTMPLCQEPLDDLPEELQDLIASSPRFIDKYAAAELVTRYFFPAGPRIFERWDDVPVRYVNRRNVRPTAAIVRKAHAMLCAAKPMQRPFPEAKPRRTTA